MQVPFIADTHLGWMLFQLTALVLFTRLEMIGCKNAIILLFNFACGQFRVDHPHHMLTLVSACLNS